MADVTFITGNANKAKYFAELIGLPIPHHSANMDEIQSLDLVEIASHKAKQAYNQLKRPVLVEDAGVAINAMGQLPGPFIKWFVEETGVEKICRMADMDSDRSAVASDAFVYYDGKVIQSFIGSLRGRISEAPRGDGGYDWDRIFIPEGETKTLAEMESKDYQKFHVLIKPILEVRKFLDELDRS